MNRRMATLDEIYLLLDHERRSHWRIRKKMKPFGFSWLQFHQTLYDSYYNETPDLSLAGSDLTTPTTIRALLRR